MTAVKPLALTGVKPDETAGRGRSTGGGVAAASACIEALSATVALMAGESTDWVYGAPAKLGTAQVGSLRIGVSTTGLDKELQTSLSQAEDRARAARNRMLLVSLVVLAIGVVLDPRCRATDGGGKDHIRYRNVHARVARRQEACCEQRERVTN